MSELYVNTPEEHTAYWERQLEIAERKREYALRQLGRLGIEEHKDGRD